MPFVEFPVVSQQILSIFEICPYRYSMIHLISLNTRCITICTLQFACLETLLRPYLLELETLERCLVRALQPGALVHTGTTGDNGGQRERGTTGGQRGTTGDGDKRHRKDLRRDFGQNQHF